MFRIYADEKLIWTPKDNDRKVLNPKVTLEVNKVGSASFSILPNHIYYDNLVKMKTIISIIQEERTIFKGRVNELKPAISEEVIISSQDYITEQVEKAVDEAFRERKKVWFTSPETLTVY